MQRPYYIICSAEGGMEGVAKRHWNLCQHGVMEEDEAGRFPDEPRRCGS